MSNSVDIGGRTPDDHIACNVQPQCNDAINTSCFLVNAACWSLHVSMWRHCSWHFLQTKHSPSVLHCVQPCSECHLRAKRAVRSLQAGVGARPANNAAVPAPAPTPEATAEPAEQERASCDVALLVGLQQKCFCCNSERHALQAQTAPHAHASCMRSMHAHACVFQLSAGQTSWCVCLVHLLCLQSMLLQQQQLQLKTLAGMEKKSCLLMKGNTSQA